MSFLACLFATRLFARRVPMPVMEPTPSVAPRAIVVSPVVPAAVATTKGRSRVALSVAAGVACFTCVGVKEQLRTTAYRDIVGVPTICYGETQHVRMGETRTKEQCVTLFMRRLDEFGAAVEACVPSAKTMPLDRYAAHVSLAYNVGVAGYCGSSVARLENAGRTREACEAFMSWNKVRKNKVLVVSGGLTNRRADERALCLKGA